MTIFRTNGDKGIWRSDLDRRKSRAPLPGLDRRLHFGLGMQAIDIGRHHLLAGIIIWPADYLKGLAAMVPPTCHAASSADRPIFKKSPRVQFLASGVVKIGFLAKKYSDFTYLHKFSTDF